MSARLTSAADYLDLHDALYQSCLDLVGSTETLSGTAYDSTVTDIALARLAEAEPHETPRPPTARRDAAE